MLEDGEKREKKQRWNTVKKVGDTVVQDEEKKRKGASLAIQEEEEKMDTK